MSDNTITIQFMSNKEIPIDLKVVKEIPTNKVKYQVTNTFGCVYGEYKMFGEALDKYYEIEGK